MSDRDYKYKGISVSLKATKKTNQPETWLADFSLNGAVRAATAFEDYPPKLCPTEAEALAYAKRGAEWIIDHPTSGHSKKKEEE